MESVVSKITRHRLGSQVEGVILKWLREMNRQAKWEKVRRLISSYDMGELLNDCRALLDSHDATCYYNPCLDGFRSHGIFYPGIMDVESRICPHFRYDASAELVAHFIIHVPKDGSSRPNEGLLKKWLDCVQQASLIYRHGIKKMLYGGDLELLVELVST